MKILILKNYLFTLIIFYLIVGLISRGEFLTTASQYPSDYLFLWTGLIGGLWLSWYSVIVLKRATWHKVCGYYILYYFGALGVFADGHIAGWSHTESIFDKILMAGFNIVVLLFTVIIPLFILSVSMLQAYFLSIAVENRKIETELYFK